MIDNVLILGHRRRGKSSLAESLTRTYIDEGIECVVQEPFYTGRPWTGCEEVRTCDELFRLVDTKKDLAIFIEEYARALQSDNKPGDSLVEMKRKRIHNMERMTVLSTSSGHSMGSKSRGHVVHFSCHRLTQFGVTLRDQCRELYLFASRSDDADELAKEYNAPELRSAPGLRPGEFFHVEDGQPAELLEIDFASLQIRAIHGRHWKPESQRV